MKIIGANITGSFILNNQDVTNTVQSSSAWSGSVASQIDSLNAATASLYAVSASLNSATASLNAATSSLFNATASLFNATSSLNAATSSLNTATASFSSSIASLNSFTSSQTALNNTFATTGSNNFVGNQVVSGSFTTSGSITATGTITAQTLVVQTITSSVSTVTGSTKFGSTGSNTHQFTGSVNVTGSLTVTTTGTELQVNSTGVNLGNALTDSHTISGSLTVNPNGLFVSSSGNVGVNTITPAFNFTVSGKQSTATSTDTTGAINPGTSEFISTGFNLAANASQDISGIGLSSSSSWKAIVRGGYANNVEGGGLTSSGLEIEVDNNNPTISVGGTPITFSRNASTSKLQVTNGSASNRVTFVGTILLINYEQGVLPTVSKIMLRNVGIGTTSPSARLHVSSSTAASTVFRVDTATNNGTLFVSSSGNVGMGTTNPGHTLDIVTSTNQSGLRVQGNVDNAIVFVSSTATGGQEWRLQSTGGTSGLGQGKLFFKVGTTETAANIPLVLYTDNGTNGGRVGIGVTSPLSALHVLGQSGTTGLPSLLLYGESPSNGQRYGFNVSADQLDISALGANGRIAFFTGGNASTAASQERMRITSGGNLLFAGTTAGAGNSIALRGDNQGASGYAYLQVSGTGSITETMYMYNSTGLVGSVGTNSSNMTFSLTTTERMRLTGGGVLKIGNGGTADDSSNPGYKNVAISFNNASNRGEIQAVQQTLSVYPLAINGAGGNVGIGTYSPATKLHVAGAIGSGTSTYPQNVRLVKTGTTSVVFTVTVPYANNWNPAYSTIRVAGSRTGLEESWAAMYFCRMTYYGGSGVSLAVNNVSGNTGEASVSVSSNTANPQVWTITISDGGSSTDYLIADIDISVNGGIISIS